MFGLEMNVFCAPQQGSYTPTNSELLEYWVSKRSPDRLLACEHTVVDYEIEGAKVKTNLLFEAATTANSVGRILFYYCATHSVKNVLIYLCFYCLTKL